MNLYIRPNRTSHLGRWQGTQLFGNHFTRTTQIEHVLAEIVVRQETVQVIHQVLGWKR